MVIIYEVNASDLANLYNRKGRDNSSVVIAIDLEESDRPKEKDYIDRNAGKETW